MSLFSRWISLLIVVTFAVAANGEAFERLASTRIKTSLKQPSLSGAIDSSTQNQSAEPADTSSQPRDLLGDHDELRSEIAEARRRYKNWKMTRRVRKFGVVLQDLDDEYELNWDSVDPIEIVRHEFIRSSDRFRAECTQPALQRTIFAYDGEIARVRNVRQLQNGPYHSLMNLFEETFTPELPHCVFVDLQFAPDTEWLYGTREPMRLFPQAFIVGKPTIETVEHRGHPCWRILWKALDNEEMEVLTFCELLLARDRMLMPIYQEYRTPSSFDGFETRRIETDQFQQEELTGRWFPKLATITHADDIWLQVSKIDYTISSESLAPEIFSDAPAIAEEHSNPPPAIVSQYVPGTLFSRLPGPGSNSHDSVRAFRIKASLIAFGVIAVAAVFLSIILKTTRLGRLSRVMIKQHRIWLGVTGAILAVAVASICAYPPGWWTFGLSMMIAGLFGLAWIGFSLVLIGQSQVTIRVVMAAAACSAMLLGGYHKGIKRMQVRQQMIQQIRAEGGQVVMGRWRLDEDGLYLPRAMRQLLGEAWSGRANRALVTNRQFTAPTVSRWCLDEVRWLGVASIDKAPYTVDPNALAKIKDFGTLWTLHFEGGHLNDSAMRELSRFNRLIDLHFDCQYRPLARSIADIPELERLWLTHPVVDDQFIETLQSIDRLDRITLIAPQFRPCTNDRFDLNLVEVEVRHATIDALAMDALGRFPTKLDFVDCQINLSPQQGALMRQTQACTFRNSDVDDITLAEFHHSPNLEWLILNDTDVSVQGLERFSSIRPEVSLLLE